MEAESPETLVKFVKTMTSSVQSVLRSPNNCRPVTQQNYTRRRRLKKRMKNIEKSSEKQQQYLAQQYSIQHMYSTSMLNAAPVCFGDKRNTLLGLESPLQQFNLDGVGVEIETCEQFLTNYIPAISSPRENRMQSYEIYKVFNNLQYNRSTCMYDNHKLYNVDHIIPLDESRNDTQNTCTNEWSDIIISSECEYRSEQLSNSYDNDESLDETLDEIFDEIEQTSLSLSDVSQSVDSDYWGDGESSQTALSFSDSLSNESNDFSSSDTFSSPSSIKFSTVLPSFSSIFLK